VRVRKSPISTAELISLTRPIRPLPLRPAAIAALEDLPPITSTHFYTSFTPSMTHLRWHEIPDRDPELPNDRRPIWMHPLATYIPWCNHTKFLHRLYMWYPTTHWRPITRSLVIRFCNAITCGSTALSFSIRLYLGPIGLDDSSSMDESVSDLSTSITSADEPGNQVLFLFRFWIHDDNLVNRDAQHVTEREVNQESIDIINSIIADYDIDNYDRFIMELMTGPIIEI